MIAREHRSPYTRLPHLGPEPTSCSLYDLAAVEIQCSTHRNLSHFHGLNLPPSPPFHQFLTEACAGTLARCSSSDVARYRPIARMMTFPSYGFRLINHLHCLIIAGPWTARSAGSARPSQTRRREISHRVELDPALQVLACKPS